MIEVHEQIAAVRRRVVRATADGREREGVELEQELPTSAADLWDAITSAERVPRWFLPVAGDLREGGRYALEGNAEGTVERCTPPESFVLTWEFGGDVSRVVVRVAPAGPDRATLSLEHLAAAGHPSWDTFGPGAGGVGWDLSLLGLALYVGSRGAFDPEAGTTWAGEDDGARFVALSGEAWHDADVAAGADPGAARAAADRTIAAYTEEPEDGDA
jgi:uncharacterized protein YndB with AHSA1/START domain